MTDASVEVAAEVMAALTAGRPVVALESTVIAHGLPWPMNLETARAAEAAARAEGAVPATVAVWRGRPTVGLSAEQLEGLARSRGTAKASRRDLAAAVAGRRTAATTVAATAALAHRAGIRLFATGGIGGAHRDALQPWDISADLVELSRTPIAVVCAGAKSILDLPRTLEILETLGVPVVGYRTDSFPAFYLHSSGLPVPARVDTPAEAAAVLTAHWQLGGGGVVLAQPVAPEVAVDPATWDQALAEAERQAAASGVRGPALTPFLLARLAEITQGQTLRANHALVVANARLAAQVAAAYLRADTGHA
ncbi:MAG: pseudouridine-5'-phosphate glycosidase [Gemmataceae bacterium]|nr:pseudouridine-5'-phosphate glycosidase [Gemmataceae bacterium]MDW8266793.1 pseudouridine-5'-phosphate glycosidase [Gemmataceae bacterium]